ncbi:hypothetical protein NUM_51090 [Actinocatenispora comari]|uniref:Uncharacterized protein n=1 Tax=Actinocatenispora comari TaxID=2807577 RepID=A0A8J4AHW6_9ACTN|nr:hypothetical protein NUM_51090 [Actinocatenispora comari]
MRIEEACAAWLVTITNATNATATSTVSRSNLPPILVGAVMRSCMASPSWSYESVPPILCAGEAPLQVLQPGLKQDTARNGVIRCPDDGYSGGVPDRSDVSRCDASGESRDELAESLRFQGDVETDRGRWQLYRQALGSEDHHPLLLAALRHEPDPQLVLSVAYLAISMLPDALHPAWTSVVPELLRHKAAERSAEVSMLRRAVVGRLASEEIEPTSWTNWLQLRMASQAIDRAIVDDLADNGRTKRIRNAATLRSRSLAAVRTDAGGHAGESLGDVQLDGILPTASGCSDENKTVNGSVVVSCRDLTAEWQPTVTEPVDSTGLV